MSGGEGQQDNSVRGDCADAAPAPDVVRVAIVGGGCAGISAAWQLSALNDRVKAKEEERAKERERASEKGKKCERKEDEKLVYYDIHVYEQSWALGGKGASFRDSETGRIKEHGLHVWLGFYDNAFRMVRDCYRQVGSKGWSPTHMDPACRLPHASFDEAFFPEPHIGVAGLDRAKNPMFWSGQLPPMKGLPGDPINDENNPFTLANYLWRCLHLVKTLMQSISGAPDKGVAGMSRPDERSRFDEAMELNFDFDPIRSPAVLIERMTRLLRGTALTTAAGLLQAIGIAEDWLRSFAFGSRSGQTVRDFIEALATQTRKMLQDIVAIDEETRRKTEIIDIVMTIVVGLWRDRVLFNKQGLDAINGIDYRAWLSKHGATKAAVESRFITGIYDLVFAYREGNHKRPALAAGVALRGALRMFFTYRGAMFWRMRSGMGDAVFAPLYKVLQSKDRVQFHFQHSLKKIDFEWVDEKCPRVKSLTFDLPGARADIDGAKPGDVLDHFGCWPNVARSPLVSAPQDALAGLAIKDTFTLYADKPEGEGFDAVIFALGIKELGEAAADLGEEAFPDWNRMLKNVKTVGTRALQVWWDKDLDELGWNRGPALISALDPPYETWADMTHTLTSEQLWREMRKSDEPKKSEAEARELEAAKGESAKFEPTDTEPVEVEPEDGGPLEGEQVPMGPVLRSVSYFCGVLPQFEFERGDKAPDDEHQDVQSQFKKLWPRFAESGASRVDHYSHNNGHGSERYTLSLPGSLRYRISPLDAIFDNATIAGDWTACGLDAGCIEAAVMSGMLAAHAVTGGTPSLDDIVGYHHP